MYLRDSCDECRRLKERCEGGTPCKRCIHLGRSCDFDTSPSLDKRATVLTGAHKSLTERIQLMERLLKHYVPAIDLNIDSLRQACDALSVPSPNSTDVRSSPGIASSDSAIHDAVNNFDIGDTLCTVGNVDGAIARESDLGR